MSDHSIIKEQPGPVPSPSVNGGDYSTPGPLTLRTRARHVVRKLTTKEGWLGDYDYAWLCTPTLPFTVGGKKRRTSPPFYALDSELPLLLALGCGLQHALAMLAGLITPPIIFASALNLDGPTSAYLISASLIGCGILSLVQMSRLHLFKNYYLGTGLISVVGTSFATLSTANAVSRLFGESGSLPNWVTTW
ncbi:hypothetical protein PHLCEN_2v3456 [Hermanssonia centrifuga]|uniref:Uncharacterized protein n=1 Tax=Hermanssonia centrifuga TaxID=98765 RepID=A0A2R6QIN6_9APHY|nr:hypothetical protein PHLCEN_2v3456 [Hermanssonia centrifuga]